jgi:hypothetical protein
MHGWVWLFVGACVAHPELGGGSATTGDDPTQPGDDPVDPGVDTDGGDGGGDGAPTDPPGETPTDDGIQQLCVDEINAYRATLGLYPYERWEEGEACADDECRQDSESGLAHGAFGQCGEWAQNECPGWPQPIDGSIQDCLAMMWAEGPGEDFSVHGHYINMSSESYTEVACGYYITPAGDYWAIQNFR